VKERSVCKVYLISTFSLFRSEMGSVGGLIREMCVRDGVDGERLRWRWGGGLQGERDWVDKCREGWLIIKMRVFCSCLVEGGEVDG
jgi:hypothetical protein